MIRMNPIRTSAGLAAFALSAACASGQMPPWWQARGVLTPVAVTNDFAPVNQGQAKQIATQAYLEFEDQLPGGAGFPLGLIPGDDYAPVNVGQLKALAAPFYDRLTSLSFAGGYPWTGSLVTNDFALCNVGQVKHAFSFAANRIHADAGFAAGCELKTWWTQEGVDWVNSSLRDGGFEQYSPPDGRFPTSGCWAAYTSGGQAGAVVTTTAKNNGKYGLWNYTGSNAALAELFSSPYQQFDCSPGDTWKASAWIRQPGDQGGTWVDRASAMVRLRFFEPGGQAIQSFVSSTNVNKANQGWTSCSVTGTAMAGTAFVRMELLVQKPYASGIAVAAFDDCVFQKRNSFVPDLYSEAPVPEGDHVFRTFALKPAGWAVQKTSGTFDFTFLTNGYLSFWLMSDAASKVEVQSVSGVITNTHLVGNFNATTMPVGGLGWERKVIPIRSIPGLNAARVSSPFRFHALGTNSVSFVDEVYWTYAPGRTEPEAPASLPSSPSKDKKSRR